MKLNLVGEVNGNSGYSIHTKNLALALIKKGVDLSIESRMMPNPETNEKLIDAIKKASKYAYEGTIMINFPTETALKSGDRLPFLLPFCVFEGNKLNYGWTEALKKEYITAILTPSEETKKIIKNSGIKKKIYVVPHGVDTKIFNNRIEANPHFENKSKYTFLFVGGWKDGIKDRKGLDLLCKAFCEEFKKEENVRLMLKINMAYQEENQVLKNFYDLDLPKKEERPEIALFMQQFPEKIMAELYSSADCFVNVSKGESFCLPCLEASACNTPVISVNWGGQIDFLKNYIEIKDGKETEATGGMLYEGVKWKTAEIESIKKALRYAFGNQKEVKEMGRKQGIISRKYTWENSAKKLIEAIDEVNKPKDKKI